MLYYIFYCIYTCAVLPWQELLYIKKFLSTATARYRFFGNRSLRSVHLLTRRTYVDRPLGLEAKRFCGFGSDATWPPIPVDQPFSYQGLCGKFIQPTRPSSRCWSCCPPSTTSLCTPEPWTLRIQPQYQRWEVMWSIPTGLKSHNSTGFSSYSKVETSSVDEDFHCNALTPCQHFADGVRYAKALAIKATKILLFVFEP